MKPFHEALTEGNGWDLRDDGRAVLTLSRGDEQVTVEFEPLLFGQYHLAIYDAAGDLLAEKVPVYPGGTAAARTIALEGQGT